MTRANYQRTLCKPVSFSGIGVHGGKEVAVTLRPAPVNHGIKFTRVDLMDRPTLPAHFNMVVDTSQATVIGFNGYIVSTIEHLMATFSGLGIDNAIVELDGHEMPIMDGSAGPFTEMILDAGICQQEGPRCYFVIKEPIELKENGKFVGLYPYPGFKITYTIDYDHPLIGNQTVSVDIDEATFAKDISWARTFGFLQEYEYMKYYGLALGGSLDNVLVIDEEEVVNPEGLRYTDEFVRHKILDCIGDFSLLGMPIQGHIKAVKSGHAFNHQFLNTFFRSKSSWETITHHSPAGPISPSPKQLAI